MRCIYCNIATQNNVSIFRLTIEIRNRLIYFSFILQFFHFFNTSCVTTCRWRSIYRIITRILLINLGMSLKIMTVNGTMTIDNKYKMFLALYITAIKLINTSKYKFFKTVVPQPITLDVFSVWSICTFNSRLRYLEFELRCLQAHLPWVLQIWQQEAYPLQKMFPTPFSNVAFIDTDDWPYHNAKTCIFTLPQLGTRIQFG